MPKESTHSRTIKSLARACEIIELLRNLDGATISELSNHIDLSIGTIHAHLTTLKEQGYVTQIDNTYKLSLHLVTVGEYVRNHTKLFRAGHEEADKLAKETGECTHLIVEHEGIGVSLYEAFGPDTVGKKFYLKNREESETHLHYSAAGKAILAHLPKDRIHEIIDRHGLPELTSTTITDLEELLAELETVQEQGYALNDEEEIIGLRAVGVPIHDGYGSVLGSISLSAPSKRMKNEQFRKEIPETVMQAANVIEVNIQTQDLNI